MALRGQLRVVAIVVLTAASLAIWSQAPRRIAHWSPSGELFVSTTGSRTEKIGLLPGDGLSPLRFSAAASFECEEAHCDKKTESGALIRIQKGPEPTICILAPAGNALSPEDCGGKSGPLEQTWTWPEITKSGGRTAYLKGGKLRIIDAPSCGIRPWHPCPEIPSARSSPDVGDD